MLHTILPTQMQAAEQTAFAAGLSPLLTMETAARAAFDVLLDLLGCDCRGKNVLFLCGPGNNGGDGLVMARLLLQARGFARIILLDTPKTAEAQINLRHLQAMGADIEAVPDELLEDEYDAVVDALFGTGFTGSIAADSPAGRLLTWANTCGPMLSIDVPSGMDAATGAVEGVCARAIWTVTFHRPKPGLYLTERRDCVGEITVAPIGLPREFDPQGGLLVNEEGDLHTLLPDRPASAHKGDCGRTVIYAGSLGMAGAAMMAARAALHAGAGLTTVICPRAAMPVLQQEVPNATCLAAEDQPTPKCDALLMGCGIAENDDTYADMMRLKATDAYQVWDAGALNLLAGHPQQLGARGDHPACGRGGASAWLGNSRCAIGQAGRGGGAAGEVRLQCGAQVRGNGDADGGRAAVRAERGGFARAGQGRQRRRAGGHSGIAPGAGSAHV